MSTFSSVAPPSRLMVHVTELSSTTSTREGPPPEPAEVSCRVAMPSGVRANAGCCPDVGGVDTVTSFPGRVALLMLRVVVPDATSSVAERSVPRFSAARCTTTVPFTPGEARFVGTGDAGSDGVPEQPAATAQRLATTALRRTRLDIMRLCRCWRERGMRSPR
jgi:hypothetical protein